MKSYNSKIDGWLLALIVLSAIGCLAASYVAIASLHWSVIVFVVGLGVVLPGWILNSTKYSVSNGVLLITSGPFSWKIPIEEIVSVRATRNALSSPALSLDRLELVYNRKSILVSPKDQEGFCEAIGHPRIQ